MAYKRSGETRDRILRAAAGLFAERGYYATDVAEIAAEAGISRASFYYYYADKEKVARAVFDSYVDRLYSAAEKAAPNTAAPGSATPEKAASGKAASGKAASGKAASGKSALEDRGGLDASILQVFVKYILLFKFIALNRATHAVYYDLVNFADYDEANIQRLERTTYADTRRLAAAYGKRLTRAEHVAFIVTTNAVAKSIFKAMSNGILSFSLAEAADYFFRHAVLPDVPIPEPTYRRVLAKALKLCESIGLDAD